TGGLVLGLLGVVGGPLTLFKGLEEMKELSEQADAMTWGAILLLAVVKTGALVVATSAGFRGGRIFPTVFIGVAVGFAATALVPAVPAAVAVDRKSTRLNSSHVKISYAVFCLKKKNTMEGHFKQ